MITINTILDMRPGAVPKIIHLSQYDSDFSLVFRLHASFGTLNIESGTTAEIRGTKKSGTGYSASATLNTTNNTVTVAGDAQMTAVAGQNIYEIVFTFLGVYGGIGDVVWLLCIIPLKQLSGFKWWRTTLYVLLSYLAALVLLFAAILSVAQIQLYLEA